MEGHLGDLASQWDPKDQQRFQLAEADRHLCAGLEVAIFFGGRLREELLSVSLISWVRSLCPKVSRETGVLQGQIKP